MRRAKWAMTCLAISALVLFFRDVRAHEDVELPEGPIRDRHELMEGIGGHAKKINDALKQGKVDVIPTEADGISAKAKRIVALFPKGSTHEKSRAKPEIWEHWSEFERLAGGLERDAAGLASAARDGGDAGAAAKQMFGNCKSCHDQFRLPEED